MEDPKPHIPMPIKAVPYRHQIEAFNFACALLGLIERGDAKNISKSAGAAMLMEMG